MLRIIGADSLLITGITDAHVTDMGDQIKDILLADNSNATHTRPVFLQQSLKELTGAIDWLLTGMLIMSG